MILITTGQISPRKTCIQPVLSFKHLNSSVDDKSNEKNELEDHTGLANHDIDAIYYTLTGRGEFLLLISD